MREDEVFDGPRDTSIIDTRDYLFGYCFEWCDCIAHGEPEPCPPYHFNVVYLIANGDYLVLCNAELLRQFCQGMSFADPHGGEFAKELV